jgi:hypothetical protein
MWRQVKARVVLCAQRHPPPDVPILGLALRTPPQKYNILAAIPDTVHGSHHPHTSPPTKTTRGLLHYHHPPAPAHQPARRPTNLPAIPPSAHPT